MLDYEDAREVAINNLDDIFTRLDNDPFSMGVATGKAKAYWSVYLITYYEYDFYRNAVYGAVYGKKF